MERVLVRNLVCAQEYRWLARAKISFHAQELFAQRRPRDTARSDIGLRSCFFG